MTSKNEIYKAFDAHAEEYEQAAKVQYEIGRRLFERLHYLKIKPRFILDLGCGTGIFSKQLKKLYPQAHVVGLDLALGMLKQAKQKHRWHQKWTVINGDMMKLPFATGLFDLIFSNQVIHWAPTLSGVLAEINRVMNTSGCLMFSTLGPDTFQELKYAWSSVDKYAHVNEFDDMHDLGDALLAQHFLDPVVDMERLTAHYATPMQLIRALKAQGVRNINSERNPGLTGKKQWHQFEHTLASLKTPEGKLPLTYEVVYGHAWKGQQRRIDKGVETVIPISKIQRASGR